MNRAITINEKDNIAVCLTDLQKGENLAVNGTTLTVVQNVPAKHKVALKAFEEGDKIYMYGVLVGVAKKTIRQGEHQRFHKGS